MYKKINLFIQTDVKDHWKTTPKNEQTFYSFKTLSKTIFFVKVTIFIKKQKNIFIMNGAILMVPTIYRRYLIISRVFKCLLKYLTLYGVLKNVNIHFHLKKKRFEELGFWCGEYKTLTTSEAQLFESLFLRIV